MRLRIDSSFRGLINSIFATKGDENPKARVPDPLELNKLHQDYNMLHRDVQRDISFSGYLELLGVKEGTHG